MKILYVLHSGITGGTFLTNKDLMKNVQKFHKIYLLSAENDYFALFSYSNNELNLIKKYPRNLNLNVVYNNCNSHEKKWSAKIFHDSWLSFVYFDILNNHDINLIHIRHLINHSFDLPQLAKKLGIPVVLSMHDFYFLCPFYTLLDENNSYCAGKCSDNNENCYIPMSSLNDINSKEFISEWRNNVSKMFLNIDYFITTSDFVKNLFLEEYDNNVLNDGNFKVIEHGRDLTRLRRKFYEIPSLEKPIKILCPANHLNIMKGSELIKSIKQQDLNNNLEFHFLGNCHDNIEDYGINHGTFERDEFYKKVKEIRPSFIGIFSIWPETFCHTITEAWSCGIPVIGSDIGVIKDRILKNNGGWLIDRNDPKKAFDTIMNISSNPEMYLDVVNNIKKLSFKSTLEMSEQYMDIYNELL